MTTDLGRGEVPHFRNRTAMTLARLLVVAYGVILLLVLSAAVLTLTNSTKNSTPRGEEANRFQEYQEEVRLLTLLREPLNQGQNAVRDLLLSWNGDRITVFDRRIKAVQVIAEEGLRHLQTRTSINPEVVSELRQRFAAYWNTVVQPRAWTESERRERADSFIPQELQASRRGVGRLLQEHINQSQIAGKDIEAAWEHRRERLMIANLGVLAVLMIVVMGTGALTYRYSLESARERLQKYDELKQSRADLEQLSARLMVIQESERKRLSRELHDGIGQTLTALRMEISHLYAMEASGENQGQERLQRARNLAEEAMRTVRDIALLLRPTVLDDLGLEPALRWQAEDFAARTSFRCIFRCSGIPENLPEAVKTCVYRVVQESLNNCQKHASPTTVSVTIGLNDRVLTVAVEDDGYGFEMKANGTPARSVGLGFLGMRERVAMLDGQLLIQSAPGRGTKVMLSLPMTDAISRDKAEVPSEQLHANTHTAG
jgi:signal transduction histidine kinase